MNIFVTSFNQLQAVKHLDDLRLNKMILETALMLSTSYRILFGDNEQVYKTSFLNHPCTIWARKNIYTYSWLVDYFDAAAKEKYYRDSTIKKNVNMHLSYIKLYKIFNTKYNQDYKEKISNDFFDFNCTDFKEEKNIIKAYQQYMNKKWNNDLRSPKWTGNNIPSFFYKATK